MPIRNHLAPSQSAFPASPALLSPPQLTRRIAGLVMILAVSVMVLAGCGTERRSQSNAELLSATDAIAQEYAASGNLDAARTRLNELNVANPNQWLIFAAENSISTSGANPAAAQALAKLTLDMGLHSSSVSTFAQQNGLVSAPEAPTAAPPANAVFAALPSPTPLPAAVAPPATTPMTLTEVVASATVTTSVAATESAAGAAQAIATGIVNLRTGPGTNYDLAGGLSPNQPVPITAKNPTGDWWQVQLEGGQTAWVYSQLVSTAGAVESVAVAASIPTPPPLPTAAPVAEAPAAATAAPAEPAPEATAEPTAPPAADPNAAPHFTLVERRLWAKQENDGCAGKHLLRINVLDANGGRINGVALQGIYTGQTFVTGDQGKGDGIIEFDLYGPGEGFKVIRNNDGRDATSDNAEGFTTRSLDIDVPTLIGAGYCTNDADCQIFYNSYGCTGHHSWEATFKRNY